MYVIYGVLYWVRNLRTFFSFFFFQTLFPLLNKVDEMIENVGRKAAICYNGRELFSLPPSYG